MLPNFLAIENWGNPVTLTLDAIAGTLYIVLLPWVVPIERESILSK